MFVRADTTSAAPPLTETAAPDSPTSVAVRSDKRNSNCARPNYGQTASSITPADPDSDVTSVARFVGSDSDSEYFESAKKPRTSPASMMEFTGHIRELE